LAHRLLAPKFHVDKTYFARIDGVVEDDMVAKFASGFKVDDSLEALSSKLKIISSGQISEVEITIHEGKFHQIKRMFEAFDMKVIYLKRLEFGPIKLDENLEEGQYRRLTSSELESLKKI
jgi:16S rRNA pseudouridine516 synthase